MKLRLPHRVKLIKIATVLAFFLIVPLLAAVSAMVGPYSLLPYVAIAGAIAAFTLQLSTVVVLCLLSASFLAGVLEYFVGISQGFWLPFLMGLLMALRGVAELFRPQTQASEQGHQRMPLHSAQVLGLIYMAIAVFGVVVDMPTLPQVLVAAKNYFFMWGVLLVLIWSPWQATSSQKFLNAVIFIACLQLPFTLYQRFVVAARRRDTAAWDSVVGTLGGDPSGGGNSAAMAFLCCIAIAVIGMRMRDRKMDLLPGALMLVICVLPIALAEVKAAFIWLLIVFFILVWRQIVREPLRAISTVLGGLVLIAGVGFTYTLAYQDQMGANTSWEQIYDKQIKYSIDPNEFSSQHQRLGRTTALVYWWEKHDLGADPLHFLMGHGLGASRSSSSLGLSELAKRLPYAVDGTGFSTLLWDVGLLGALAFTGMLGSAMAAVFRVGRQEGLDPIWRESTSIAGVVLVLALFGLIYNKDAIDNPTIQLLLMFSIAQLFMARRVSMPASARAGKNPTSPEAAANFAQPATHRLN